MGGNNVIQMTLNHFSNILLKLPFTEGSNDKLYLRFYLVAPIFLPYFAPVGTLLTASIFCTKEATIVVFIFSTLSESRSFFFSSRLR
ncbi:hypothetical protein NUACC26_056810 [Scytonema sp. NUACC26]